MLSYLYKYGLKFYYAAEHCARWNHTPLPAPILKFSCTENKRSVKCIFLTQSDKKQFSPSTLKRWHLNCNTKDKELPRKSGIKSIPDKWRSKDPEAAKTVAGLWDRKEWKGMKWCQRRKGTTEGSKQGHDVTLYVLGSFRLLCGEWTTGAEVWTVRPKFLSLYEWQMVVAWTKAREIKRRKIQNMFYR